MIKFICFNRLYFFGIFLFSMNANADIAIVYCANDKKKWHWLNKKKEIVRGKWENKFVKPWLYKKYFIIKGGMSKVHSLQEQCILTFGSEFHYAQPAEIGSEDWHVFAINDDTLIKGISSYRTFSIRV
ncbi:hypothetical protein [Fluviispira multicolorata]|uniref:Uncharacterized protein n=1 Tax=Fluviispira multicolorata TaxID=2654512 RepID=A0A833N5N5_9BACT|nr:hypothetical protein [Fluviispira multicolorata]KAB8030952.1 hypothetical protein GCL57_08260 [Fluviispira multicolorata]